MDNDRLKNRLETISNEIDQTIVEIEKLRNKTITITNPTSLEQFEKKVAKATDKLAGLITAKTIQESLESKEVRQRSSELLNSLPKKMESQGFRDVEIVPSRGEPVIITVRYYTRKKTIRMKRNRSNKGLYPGLFILHIIDHLTPGLCAEMCLMATIVGSYNEACQVMNDRGVKIDAKKLSEITRRFANRAEMAKRDSNVFKTETLAGCSVVISTDGGRIRIRKKKRGCKTKKGRNRYSTKWKEPKLMIIYTVNEQGEKESSFLPIIEGTMKGPEAVFGVIKFYLLRLEITKASKILFVADGARWIWNRVPDLARSLGAPLDRFYSLVDFYHAVEHLAKVSELRKGWKKAEKKKWLKKHRRLLLSGKVKDVVNSICSICRGRNSKKLRTEKDYFVRNQKRMQYDLISGLGLPIGSGAMESAIRRVVNLRLKGAATYWLEKTAESMLLLRSYYKSGRWNTLKRIIYSGTYSQVG